MQRRTDVLDDPEVIADYSIIYDAKIFEDESPEDVLDSIAKIVDSSLDALKNMTVGNYSVDENYIDDEVKDELDDASECKKLV